jgi:hypothetical protein
MTRFAYLWWLLAPLPLFLPLLFIPRVMFLGNPDALFYGNILAMMSDSMKSGVLLPRWLADANAGFGSPVMMFYAPLAYIVTAWITLPLSPLHMGIGAQLVAGMYASQVVSGSTAYAWLKRSFAPRVAMTGSLLFVLLPYKFIYIYLHINLSQLWALALLPLWMMAAQDMLRGGRRAIGWYALALAGVYYTHPLTLIAFGAVPGAYVMWFGRRTLLRSVTRLGVAHVLGLGLCMLQALPAHFAMPWIHAERFMEGKYLWRDNFYHIDVILCAYYGMIALLVGAAIRYVPSLAGSAMAKEGVFWIIVIAAVLFLTQRPSTLIWEIITPLQYLQFPAARLHAPALLGVTYLICLWLSSYKEMTPLGDFACRRTTLALFVAIFAVATGWHVYTVESDPNHASDSYLGDAQRAKILAAEPASVYETRWGCIDIVRVYNLYVNHQVPPPVAVVSGEAEVTGLEWSPPGRIALHVDVRSKEARLAVRQCYIPLWRAQDETGRNILLSPGISSGILELALPHGAHVVEISLARPQEEILGRQVALAAFIIILILLLIPVAKPDRDVPAPV